MRLLSVSFLLPVFQDFVHFEIPDYNARMRLPVLLLIVFVTLSKAQDQLPASVSGIVMNASTNSPFPGVMVMMAGAGVTTTEENGRFTLKDVRPGTWTIQALRSATAPPARDSAPRVITVKSGEDIRDVRLWLAPLGTLRGRIMDPEGNPLRGVTVDPLVVAYQAGSKTLQLPEIAVGGSNHGFTGGDGEYEVKLPPGTYYVATTYYAPRQPQVISSVDSLRTGIRTYYPGTLDSELAATVTLVGGDTAYADFKVFFKGPTLPKIAGTVVGARRASGPSVGLRVVPTLKLIPRNVAGYAASSATRMIPDYRMFAQTASPDGFEIQGVPTGTYDLVVDDVMLDGRQGRGVVRIDMRDRDLENIVVVLGPRQDIEGKVIVQGSTNAIPLEQVAIRGGPPVVMAAADGTFTLREVGEGAQSIRVDGLPPDAYVADIRQGPVSLFDAARTLSGPQYTISGSYAAPLEVIVSPNGGVIDGVVDAPAQQNVAGSTVVLVPGPSRRFVQTQYRSAVVGSTGEFTFRGLAPGVYQLYAWESVPNTAWLNPDFMSSFEGRGQSVAIESGKRQSIRVRLIQRED